MNCLVDIETATVRDEDAENQRTLAKVFSSYGDVVRGLGGNPERFMEEAGIDPRLLTHPGARITIRAIGELLEDTAAALGCPDLGMRLAEVQSAQSILEPLDGLLSSAPTLHEAILCMIEHLDAYTTGMLMDLDETPDQRHFISFEFIDGLSLFPQLIEQLMLLTHNGFSWLSAGFAHSRAVWFSHLNLSSPAAYARRFNAVLKFGQEYNGIFLDENDMRARIAHCDSARFADETEIMAKRYPARTMAIDLQVRQLVRRVLTRSDECTRQHVAYLLGIQERTLNRRLSKLGTTFEIIRDEVRRDLAFRYLARADLPLTEIAGRLGYSELAVLSRSCRRWFGIPPGQMRQNLACVDANTRHLMHS